VSTVRCQRCAVTGYVDVGRFTTLRRAVQLQSTDPTLSVRTAMRTRRTTPLPASSSQTPSPSGSAAPRGPELPPTFRGLGPRAGDAVQPSRVAAGEEGATHKGREFRGFRCGGRMAHYVTCRLQRQAAGSAGHAGTQLDYSGRSIESTSTSTRTEYS